MFAKVSLGQGDSLPDSIYYQIMPEYPGGNNEMMKFIAKNMNYSKCNSSIAGCHKLYLSLIVSESGKIKETKVLKGIDGCPDANIEALRVLNLMPNWKPALKDGNPIDCKINLPMYIILK